MVNSGQKTAADDARLFNTIPLPYRASCRVLRRLVLTRLVLTRLMRVLLSLRPRPYIREPFDHQRNISQALEVTYTEKTG